MSGPALLVLTRQDLPVLQGTRDGLARGAYVLADSDSPDAVLVATGSEVWVALAARDLLVERGIQVHVVSMPSWPSVTHGAPLGPDAYTRQDGLSTDTIRTLAIDGLQAASSGHPGAPLSLAPAATVFFGRIMPHNPPDPAWPDRRRAGRPYQQDVLPAGLPRFSLEAASTAGWARWVDQAIGTDSFGASGPGGEVLARFGIGPESVAGPVAAVLGELAQL